MERFNEDNTMGYTEADLTKLNELADNLIGDDFTDQDLIKDLEERILRNYDAEKALNKMKNRRKYVVRSAVGYTVADNKKEALEILADDENARDVILTRAARGNYYHNRVKIIATK